MELDIQAWLEAYTAAVRNAFGARVVFIGLQGSFGRGEQTAESDIDAVLILDRLTGGDLPRYREMVAHLPAWERLCGFVCGRAELAGWEAGDRLTLCLDTTPIYGEPDFLLPFVSREAAVLAIRSGACAIYHACCHNFLHGRDETVLRGLQKSAFFVLRLVQYEKSGVFPRRRSALLPLLDARERALLDPDAAFEPLSSALVEWAGGLIQTYGDETA